MKNLYEVVFTAPGKSEPVGGFTVAANSIEHALEFAKAQPLTVQAEVNRVAVIAPVHHIAPEA